MNDDEAVALLTQDIESKCGPVLATCSLCSLDIRQKEELALRARCPFCGRFLTRTT